MAVVAVIFDFDDTLMPDSTSALLASRGIDPEHFWKVRAARLIADGYDQPMAYLKLILDEVRDGALAGLSNAELAAFGATLEGTWFPGLPELFADLRQIVREGSRGITIEFHIITGGLQALVEGTELVAREFDGVYGCQLGQDPQSGVVDSIKRCVTFTEKTRFLFEINKGITQEAASRNPYLVNEFVPENARPVPMQNMIYVGDGLTDIPCFSLIKKGGGIPFGVLKPGTESAKQAFQKLLATDRVHGTYPPDYRDTEALGSLLRAAVASTCARIGLAGATAV